MLFTKTKSRIASSVVVGLMLAWQLVVPMTANAITGYSAVLSSPTPPASSTTYTWDVSGVKPGPGQEISHVDITGCWDANDVASLTANNGEEEVKSDGTLKVDNLQDDDLPLTVTAVFNTAFASTGSANVFVKTGGGSDAGFNFATAGPNCEVEVPVDEPEDETATLTIKKQAEPSSAQDFNFTSDELGNFTLDDDSDSTLENNKVFSSLSAGDYAVTEQATDGWELVFVVCEGTDDYMVLMDDNKLLVSLVAGDEVVCTFINEEEEGEVLDDNDNPTPGNGTISGHKFEDQNMNGAWDNGEPTLEGWTITSTEVCGNDNTPCGSTDSTQTDVSGSFLFNNVTSGNYRVCEVQQNGWVQTMPASGVCWIVSVQRNKDCVVDFGNFKQGEVKGSKFNDVNGNGAWDSDEPTLKDWDITLYTKTANQGVTALLFTETAVASAKTDANGAYSFGGLNPGTYKVCETQQGNWSRTYPTNSDCHEFVIDASGQVVTADFGNKAKPQILAATLVDTGTSASKHLIVGLILLSVVGAAHFLSVRRRDYAK